MRCAAQPYYRESFPARQSCLEGSGGINLDPIDPEEVNQIITTGQGERLRPRLPHEGVSTRQLLGNAA